MKVIQDGVNGKLVPFFDSDAVTQQVSELLQDTSLSERLAKEARNTIINQYNVSSCVNEWKELILHSLNNNRPGLD